MFNRGADSVSAAHEVRGASPTTPWGWSLATASKSPAESAPGQPLPGGVKQEFVLGNSFLNELTIVTHSTIGSANPNCW